MLPRVLLLALALLTALPVLGAEKVTITLRNGDRISGELTSENDERVVVSSPTLGKLRIPKAEITKRETSTLPATATPATAAKPPSPAPAPPTGAKPAGPAPAVAAAVRTNAPVSGWVGWSPAWIQPFLTNWHGNVQLGMDLGFGTSDRQTFYVNASASHSWNRLRNFADFHSAYGLVDKVQSADRRDGSLKTETDLGAKRRLYVYNQGGAGYDAIRQLDLEFHEGVGMGYKLLQRPKLTVNSELGIQYQSLDYFNSPDRSFMSLRIGENLTWNVFEKMNITERLSVSPDLDDFASYRIRLDLGLSYPLFKRITLNINAVDEYDSRPPLGVEQNDLQIQSTIG
ncbi:MAG TPA: DUF481 domain-containing protein, partial [Candidatus Limnocylindria bacterium]|nr:DUF481 domain-containing protein [Candidatus Limnocylindria bacterium]